MLKELVGFATNSGVVAVEVGIATVKQNIEVNRAQHGDVLVSATLATSIAVFNDGIALFLHHLGKAQCFTSEGTMAIGGGVLGVEDAD